MERRFRRWREFTDNHESETPETYGDELRGLLEVLSTPLRSDEAILPLIDTIHRFGNVAASLTAHEGRLGPEMDSLRNSISEFLDACDGLPLRGLKGDAALGMIRRGCASQLSAVKLAAELALKSMRSDPSRSGTGLRTTG